MNRRQRERLNLVSGKPAAAGDGQGAASAAETPAPGRNGAVALRSPGGATGHQPPARLSPAALAAIAREVEDSKTSALVDVLVSFNDRRGYLQRLLPYDPLTTALLEHLRQETELAWVRILKS